MGKIFKLLSVGDTVYSALNGKPMKVTKIYSVGFATDEYYFSFDDHKKLFYLTKKVMNYQRRGETMDKSKNYPYCDFFQHHNKDFNGGLCPCGDSFKLDGELRCARTPERIKEYRAGGYYYKCEYMITKKHAEQITLF